MATSDWTTLPNSIDNASLRAGVTAGITPPNGGSSYTFGFNSRATGFDGSSAYKYTGLNYDPISAEGGLISGALIRLPSGGTTGFAPFLFFSAQDNDVGAEGYMVGLQDDDPSSIVLRKGVLNEGLPSGNVGENGVLAKSSETISTDTWVHLRLSVLVQGTGDVLLTVEQNDLTVNSVATPVWAAITGMDTFIDDSLGINSGSLPFAGGRLGFGMYANDISRRGAVDHLTVERQLP